MLQQSIDAAKHPNLVKIDSEFRAIGDGCRGLIILKRQRLMLKLTTLKQGKFMLLQVCLDFAIGIDGDERKAGIA